MRVEITERDKKLGVRSLLRADLARFTRGRTGIGDFIATYVRYVGFRAITLYRLANWCARHDFRIPQALLLSHAVRTTGAEIQPTADIGPGLLVLHPCGIVIGAGAIVGSNCTILQNATIGEKFAPDDKHEYPTLGDNVTVCAGACILGPCQVGHDSIVGANAVVFRDVPPGSMAVGAPAIVKQRGVSAQGRHNA